MPSIVSYDSVKAGRTPRQLTGGKSWRTNFLLPPVGARDQPLVFLLEGEAGRVVNPHYHHADQFQIFVIGDGRLGSHAITRNTVHFTRAYTGYGPVVSGDKGLGWLALYPHWDGGAQPLASSREKLLAMPNRRPWQVSEAPRFTADGAVTVNPLSSISNDEGLSAAAIVLAASADTTLHHDSSSPQFIVVVGGSIVSDGKTYTGLTVVHLSATDKSFDVIAGPEGAQLLVLQFPEEDAAA